MSKKYISIQASIFLFVLNILNSLFHFFNPYYIFFIIDPTLLMLLQIIVKLTFLQSMNIRIIILFR
jgi:hypothetical protein